MMTGFMVVLREGLCEGTVKFTVKICEWDSRLLGGKCTAL